MNQSIEIAKTIVSKEALLLACIDCRDTYKIEETETHWILSPCKPTNGPMVLEDIYRICLEKEALLLLEQTLAPLREILYKKAFEPIRSRL
jgi:hypothetical protein